MTKEITTIDYKSPQVVSDLKNTVAKGATDEEFMMFAELCKSTGLNPFKREVWFIKTQGYTKGNGEVVDGKAQIMTGINGFYAIANSHPEFDGIEIIESENQITLDKATVTDWKGNASVKTLSPAVVVPEYIEAKVWRKDRRFPSTAKAKWSEYGKDLLTSKGKRSIWGQMPSIMLAKCAESLALRKAFPQELNGLYTQEEMPAEFSQVIAEEVKPALEDSKPSMSDRQVVKKLKTADELQAEQAKKAFGNDDIDLSANKNNSASKTYTYNLKSYFENMEVAKANAITRRLEKLQGFEESPDVWVVPQFIENLSQYISADQENSEAA